MQIVKAEPQLSLLMYMALDYRSMWVWVVCYGLQVTQHATQEEAESEYKSCRRHSIKANQGT